MARHCNTPQLIGIPNWRAAAREQGYLHFNGNTLQWQDTARHYNILQDTATHWDTRLARRCSRARAFTLQYQDTARHCKTLQHTARHCNTLGYQIGASLLASKGILVFEGREILVLETQHRIRTSYFATYFATYCNTHKPNWECTQDCNTNTVTHCNTLQHRKSIIESIQVTLQYTAVHCNTLQHQKSNIECIQVTLQYTATHCNTLQHTAILEIQHRMHTIYTALHCNTLQHTATLQIQHIIHTNYTSYTLHYLFKNLLCSYFEF